MIGLVKNGNRERRTSRVPLPRYHCLVWLERDVLSWEAPEILMWQPAHVGADEACPVACPPDQQFLDEVNRLFHTRFTLKDFPQKLGGAS